MSKNTKRWELLDPDGAHLHFISPLAARTRMEGGHAELVPGTSRVIRLFGHKTPPIGTRYMLNSPAELIARDSERAAGLHGPLSTYHAARIESRR